MIVQVKRQSVLGVPVFNTPQEAVNSLGKIDVSVVFVPAAGVKDAAISAIEAGIKLAVLVPDRVPVWDAMEIAAAAKANDAMFLGPNTLGALSPGKAVVEANCSACHALTNITNAGHTLRDWDTVVHMMVNAGAKVAPDQVPVVVKYLAAHFPARALPAPFVQSRQANFWLSVLVLEVAVAM